MEQTKRFCRHCEEIKSLPEFGPSPRYCYPCQRISSTRGLDVGTMPYRGGAYRTKKRICLECNSLLSASRFRERATVCSGCCKKQGKARRITLKAVREGRLQVSCLCEVCKAQPPEELHHTDYSQPLMVMCLCTRCHRRLHENLVRVRFERRPIPLEYW
jgi:hypothetical protein